METTLKELEFHVSKLLKGTSSQRCVGIATASIITLIKMQEARDPYTNGHQYHVARIAQQLARKLNLSPELRSRVFIAALLHDVGKVGLPHEILSKPAKLTNAEYQLVQQHPLIGKELLSALDPIFPNLSNIVSQHHERIDGTGYPHGLSGDDISLEVRIIGVSDVIEAIASHRPYRPALGQEKALQEIERGAGKIYDEDVSKAALSLYNSKKLNF